VIEYLPPLLGGLGGCNNVIKLIFPSFQKFQFLKTGAKNYQFEQNILNRKIIGNFSKKSLIILLNNLENNMIIIIFKVHESLSVIKAFLSYVQD